MVRWPLKSSDQIEVNGVKAGLNFVEDFMTMMTASREAVALAA